MDLTKSRLPRAVKVNGRYYRIHADFKHFLRFSALLKNRTENLEDFDFMYVKEPPADRLRGFMALCEFANPPRELPRMTREDRNTETVLDYEQDSELIYSAFMDCYGIDLIESTMHWYQFQALLHAVHDCKLTDVIGYRLYKPEGRNDAESRRMIKLHEAWRLPQPEDNEPDEELDDFLTKLEG